MATLQEIYEQSKQHFELPDFDIFQADMNDEAKRKRFYDNIAGKGVVGDDFDTFSMTVLKKKEQTEDGGVSEGVPNAVPKLASSGDSAPSQLPSAEPSPEEPPIFGGELKGVEITATQPVQDWPKLVKDNQGFLVPSAFAQPTADPKLTEKLGMGKEKEGEPVTVKPTKGVGATVMKDVQPQKHVPKPGLLNVNTIIKDELSKTAPAISTGVAPSIEKVESDIIATEQKAAKELMEVLPDAMEDVTTLLTEMGGDAYANDGQAIRDMLTKKYGPNVATIVSENAVLSYANDLIYGEIANAIYADTRRGGKVTTPAMYYMNTPMEEQVKMFEDVAEKSGISRDMAMAAWKYGMANEAYNLGVPTDALMPPPAEGDWETITNAANEQVAATADALSSFMELLTGRKTEASQAVNAVADWYRDTWINTSGGVPYQRKTIFGDIGAGVAGAGMMIIRMSLLPSSVAGMAINKLGTDLLLMGYGQEFHKKRDEGASIGEAALESAPGALHGVETFVELTTIGIFAGGTTKLISDAFKSRGFKMNAKKELLLRVNLEGGGFGGAGVASSVAQGTDVDWNQFWVDFGIGSAFGFKGGLEKVFSEAAVKKAVAEQAKKKSVTTWMTAPADMIQFVMGMDIAPKAMQAERQQILEKAVDAKERYDNATTNRERRNALADIKKNSLAATYYQNVIEINAVSRDILLRPDAYINAIRKSDMDADVKLDLIDKIQEHNATYNPKEIKAREAAEKVAALKMEQENIEADKTTPEIIKIAKAEVINEKIKEAQGEIKDAIRSEPDVDAIMGKIGKEGDVGVGTDKTVGDKIREAKIPDDVLMSGIPFTKEIWNGMVEAAAIGADAIEAGIKYIRETDWYKGLEKKQQTEAEKIIADYLQKEAEVKKEFAPEKKPEAAPEAAAKVEPTKTETDGLQRKDEGQGEKVTPPTEKSEQVSPEKSGQPEPDAAKKAEVEKLTDKLETLRKKVISEKGKKKRLAEKAKSIEQRRNELSDFIDENKASVKKISGYNLTNLAKRIAKAKTQTQVDNIVNTINNLVTKAEYGEQLNTAEAQQKSLENVKFQSNKDVSDVVKKLKTIDVTELSQEALTDFNYITNKENLNNKSVPDVKEIDTFWRKHESEFELNNTMQAAKEVFPDSKFTSIDKLIDSIYEKAEQIESGTFKAESAQDIINLKTLAGKAVSAFKEMVKNGEIELTEGERAKAEEKLDNLLDYVENYKGEFETQVKEVEREYKSERVTEAYDQITGKSDAQLTADHGKLMGNEIITFRRVLDKFNKSEKLRDEVTATETEQMEQVARQIVENGFVPTKMFDLMKTMNKKEKVVRYKDTITDAIKSESIFQKYVNANMDKLLKVMKRKAFIDIDAFFNNGKSRIEMYEEFFGEVTGSIVDMNSGRSAEMKPVLRALEKLKRSYFARHYIGQQQAKFTESLDKIGILMAQLDYAANFKQDFRIDNVNGKYRVINPTDGKHFAETFDTMKGAKDFAENRYAELMGDAKAIDLYNAVIAEGPVARLKDGDDAYKRYDKVYNQLKGKDKYLIIKTEKDILDRLKPAEQAAYRELRKYYDNNQEAMKIAAMKEGVDFVIRKFYAPGYSATSGESTVEKSNADVVNRMSASSGTLSTKSGSIYTRQEKPSYRDYNALNMLSEYNSGQFPMRYLGDTVRSQLGALSELTRRATKDDPKGGAVEKALRVFIESAYKHELTFNDVQQSFIGKALSTAIDVHKAKLLTSWHKPAIEYVTNMGKYAQGFAQGFERRPFTYTDKAEWREMLDKVKGGILKLKYADFIGRIDAGTLNSTQSTQLRKGMDYHLKMGDMAASAYTWRNDMMGEFKRRTGESFDVARFVNDQAYRDKNFDNVQRSVYVADKQAEKLFTPQTRAGQAQVLRAFFKDINTKTKAYEFTTSLQGFSIRESLNAFMVAKELLYKRDAESLVKFARVTGAMIFSNAAYRLGMSYLAALTLMTYIDDDLEEEIKEDQDKMFSLDGMVNVALGQVIMLSVGRFGNLSQMLGSGIITAGRAAELNGITEDMSIKNEKERKRDVANKKLAIESRYNKIQETLFEGLRLTTAKVSEKEYGSTKYAIEEAAKVMPIVGDAVTTIVNAGVDITAMAINIAKGEFEGDNVEEYALISAANTLFMLMYGGYPLSKDVAAYLRNMDKQQKRERREGDMTEAEKKKADEKKEKAKRELETGVKEEPKPKEKQKNTLGGGDLDSKGLNSGDLSGGKL